jgi:outer membrane protein W
MKKFLSILTVLGLAFALTATASASNTNTNSLFNANELSLTASAAGELKGQNLTSIGVGAGYFVTKNLGLEATVPVYKTDGSTVQDVSVGGVVRVPVLRYFAPYLRAGADYNWERQAWSEYAGLGVEARLNSKWGVYGGVNYVVSSPSNYKAGTWTPTVGARFVF